MSWLIMARGNFMRQDLTHQTCMHLQRKQKTIWDVFTKKKSSQPGISHFLNFISTILYGFVPFFFHHNGNIYPLDFFLLQKNVLFGPVYELWSTHWKGRKKKKKHSLHVHLRTPQPHGGFNHRLKAPTPFHTHESRDHRPQNPKGWSEHFWV